ncbi:Ldh family oxidoreductase [Caballeronia mineralivorans]|jgi:LDH2 family malate/lactate/ureidoglycolate dehydrogenase|uniref:Ldh family oxidoreductase n=1 Tax=Caballeronia mineralivorans TaxID=2010198 RepID=UPI0023EF6290|nr:Ldh family oxidoreductase [Caballeronia mineralivorans]MDB5786508.1 malate/L-sulfolactate dehydrogenase [Caballeronia mineralivorans]MEA3101418.1 delta1-piperideine-2-carboxylate reductase [Caballeronia mineralivorans]
MDDAVRLTLSELFDLSFRVLTVNGMAHDHAQAIAKVIAAGQRDECQSHGIYRLIVCVNTLRKGKVVRDAKPVITDVSPALVRVDARFGYSQLAFEMGSKVLVEKARTVGIAALSINNCFHFSALWPEVERLASEGLAALAMTPSHSWVAPAGGTKPVFGTNPIAFAWPRPGGVPFVFDFATSAIARGDIELHRRSDKKIPPGWALDAEGQPTEDPAAAMKGAMLTFGGHKGSALAAMVELLAGPLIGDLTSADSKAFDEGADATPCHGELILAFNPALFTGPDRAEHDKRAEALFDGIVSQGARLPSQRRFDARLRSEANGVNVPRKLYDDVLALIPG